MSGKSCLNLLHSRIKVMKLKQKFYLTDPWAMVKLKKNAQYFFNGKLTSLIFTRPSLEYDILKQVRRNFNYYDFLPNKNICFCLRGFRKPEIHYKIKLLVELISPVQRSYEHTERIFNSLINFYGRCHSHSTLSIPLFKYLPADKFTKQNRKIKIN